MQRISKVSSKKKLFPRLKIERYITNEKGHVIAIDLHDERFGEAVFFDSPKDRHFHGFLNKGNYQK